MAATEKFTASAGESTVILPAGRTWDGATIRNRSGDTAYIVFGTTATADGFPLDDNDPLSLGLAEGPIAAICPDAGLDLRVLRDTLG